MSEQVQRRALSAADIQSAADIKTMWVDVPEWGENAGFWARQMTQGTMMRQTMDLIRFPNDGPCLILIYSAVADESPDSPYLFSMTKYEPGVDPDKDKDAVPTDLKMLRTKSLAVLDRVQRVLVPFNQSKPREVAKKL